MTTAQKIKLCLTYRGMSEATLAKQLNTTPQAFNQRMKTDKFSTAELEQIAKVLGASYMATFEFPDGTKF